MLLRNHWLVSPTPLWTDISHQRAVVRVRGRRQSMQRWDKTCIPVCCEWKHASHKSTMADFGKGKGPRKDQLCIPSQLPLIMTTICLLYISLGCYYYTPTTTIYPPQILLVAQLYLNVLTLFESKLVQEPNTLIYSFVKYRFSSDWELLSLFTIPYNWTCTIQLKRALVRWIDQTFNHTETILMS